MVSPQIRSETRIRSDFKVSLFNEAKTDKYKTQINMCPEGNSVLNVMIQELNGRFRKLVV